MVQEKAVLDQSERTITFKNTGLIVKQDSDLPQPRGKLIGAAAFCHLVRNKEKKGYQVFTASLADINKAL